MADLGDMADQLLQAASQLSPLPKTSGSSSRTHRERSRDELLRGRRGRSPGRFAAVTTAAAAAATAARHDEPELTGSTGKRRGGGLWPPSSSFSSLGRGGANGSPRGFSDRSDVPQQAPEAWHGAHHDYEHGHYEHHRYEQGRTRPLPSGGRDSGRNGSYYDERSTVSNMDRDRDRHWDRDRDRETIHHRSHGYNNRNNNNARRHNTYGGGGNRSRSSSPVYSGFDFQGEGSGMTRRSSGGGDRYPRGMYRSGGPEGGREMNGNGGGWENGSQNSVGGGAAHDEYNSAYSTNTRETGESPLQRPRSGCGSEGGVYEPITVDSDSDEEKCQNKLGVNQQQQQQQRHPSQPRVSSPLLPPSPPHTSPWPLLAQSNGSLTNGSSSGNGINGSTARSSSTPSVTPQRRQEQSRRRKQQQQEQPPSPPQEEISQQSIEARKGSSSSRNNNNNNDDDDDDDTIGGAAAPIHMVVEALPASREAVETTRRLEMAGLRQLGDSAEVRREIVADEDLQMAAAVRCPHAKCRLREECLLDPNSMSRHLAVHTRETTEQQITRSYVRCTVAEVLHELCMDVAVPPPQRKFERRRMASGLFGTADQRLGFPAAVLETKVLGKVGNPSIRDGTVASREASKYSALCQVSLVNRLKKVHTTTQRRCASELAFGSCEGVGPPDQIVRCDTCGAWTHIHCGGISIGGTVDTMIGWPHTTRPNTLPLADGVSQSPRPPAGEGATSGAATEAAETAAVTTKSPAIPVVKEEHICRTCARVAAGPDGGDGPPGTMSMSVVARVYRKRLLGFLEREAVEGWPNGVFDLNMHIEKPAASADCERRPCSREGCDRERRFDSRFCCDGCGVLNAERLLADSLVHSLEGREGRERGQRLRANRSARKHRTQITRAARIASRPDVPALAGRNEEQLRVMVHRKWRLWKRLIEIGAYWEKVSGSKNLSAVRDLPTLVPPSPGAATAVALAARSQAAAAAAAAAAVAARNQATAPAGATATAAATTTATAAAAAATAVSGAPSDVTSARAGDSGQQQQPQQQPQDSSGQAAGTGAGVLAVMKSLAARHAREARAAGAVVSLAPSSSHRKEITPCIGADFVERQPLHRAPPACQPVDEKGSEEVDDVGKSADASANIAAITGAAVSAENSVISRELSDTSNGAAASVEAQMTKPENCVGMANKEQTATATTGGGGGGGGAGGDASVSASSSRVAGETLASANTDNNNSGRRSNTEDDSSAAHRTAAKDQSNAHLSNKGKNPTASKSTGASSSSRSITTAAAITTGTGKRAISAASGEVKYDGEMEVDVGVEQYANAASAVEVPPVTGQQQPQYTTPMAAAAIASNGAAAAPPTKRPRTNPVLAAVSLVAAPATPAAAMAALTPAPAAVATASAVLVTPVVSAVAQGVQARQLGGGSRGMQASVEALQMQIDGVIERTGAASQMCPYCGDESGPNVAKHLEECYQQVTAVRNARLNSATMRPPSVEASAAAIQARRTSLGGMALPPIVAGELAYATTVTRQLLQRRIAYAEFAALPDSGRFQLHRDLQGWMTSPSRLDLLHKELVRQRNAAMVELQGLERDEALLELKLRREWADELIGEAVPRTSRSISGTSTENNSANPVVLE